MFAPLLAESITCTTCNVAKSLGKFYRNKSKPTGRNSTCKVCVKADHVKRYATDEHRRDACRIRAKAQWRKHQADPEFREEYNRRRRIKRKVELKEGIPRVYFIRAGEHIKIGVTTNNVRERLQNLQVAHYETLTVAGVMFCDTETERELHRRFESIHVRGEWFRATPELLEFIREHANDK